MRSLDLHPAFTRADAESSWTEFVRWIGFSTLHEAILRKNRSLAEWKSFETIKPSLFSIELGIDRTLRTWKATKKLSFPKGKHIHDAYTFVTSCIRIKRSLGTHQQRIFRRRVISEILPSGRLCHLEHEFRIAHALTSSGWIILRSGYCGDAGPDFVARKGAREIEIEAKCLSPELGLGISYEFAARFFTRLERDIVSSYPEKLTTIRVEVLGSPSGLEMAKQRVVHCYQNACTSTEDEIRVTVETSPLIEFFRKFPNVTSADWVWETFSQLRTQEGDYGYFVRREAEIIFVNLIPMKPNKQRKNLLKLISTTCEKQFSKTRPAVLWLHLQGLSRESVEQDPLGTYQMMEPLARHTFKNSSRDHLSSLMFSTDTIHETGLLVDNRSGPRTTATEGYVRSFDNPKCRFAHFPIFTS